MSVEILADDFDRSGTLGAANTAWAVKTGDAWTLTGNRVRVDAAPSTVRRAVTTVDPWTLLSGAVPPGSRRIMDSEVVIVMPAAFSSTEDAYAGIVLFASNANTLPVLEAVWYRTAAGAQSYRLQFRTASSVTTYGYTVALPSSAAVGESHRLTVRLTIQDTAFARVTASWDGTEIDIRDFLSAILFGFGFPGNPVTNDHKVGLTALTPGPATMSGAPVNPFYFDDFRVRDEGVLAIQPTIYPSPTLTADPTLTTLTIASEDDSTGDVLLPQVSWAIQVQDDYPGIEQQYDSGHVATVARTAARRRKWDVRWDGLDASRKATLESLATSVDGTTKALSWTDPDTGYTIKVRFAEEPAFEQRAPAAWFASAMLEEVFA